jgi:hypothetical protein
LDNPLYSLPKLGEWDGPLFGEPGILAVDATGDHVQCGLCGQWKRKLGLHLWFEHDRTAAEYRAIWGLRQSTGLAAPSYKDEVRAANSERLARVRPSPSWVMGLTPEQRSALREGTSLPLQTLRDPAYRATMQRVGEKTTARARRWPCACGCGELLPPGNGPRRGLRYIRGHAQPPTLADRVAMHLAAEAAQGHGPQRRRDIQAALALGGQQAETSQVGRALGALVRDGRALLVARGLYQAVPEEPE